MFEEPSSPTLSGPAASAPAVAAAAAAASASPATGGLSVGGQAVLLTGVPAITRPAPPQAAFNITMHQQQQAAAHFSSLVSHQQQQVAAQQQLRMGQIQLQIQQQAAQQAQAQQTSMMQAAAPSSSVGGNGSPKQFSFPPIQMGLEVCGGPGVLQPVYYQAYALGVEKQLLCSTCQLSIPQGDVMLSVTNILPSVAPGEQELTHAVIAAVADTEMQDGEALPSVVPVPRGPTFYRHLECAQLHHLAHEADNAKIHNFHNLTAHQQMIVHHRLNFVRAKALPSSQANGFGFVPSGNAALDASTLLAKAGVATGNGLGLRLPSLGLPQINPAEFRKQRDLQMQRQRQALKRARAADDRSEGEEDQEGAGGDLDDDAKLELHLLRERLTERERMLDARERGDEFGLDGESVKPRRKRAKKDPLAPKRPASNYMFWCMYRRPQLKSASPDVNSNVLMRTMALEWKSMVKTPDVMRQWDELHEKDQARYRRQMAEWRVSGTYTEEKLDMPALTGLEAQNVGPSAQIAAAAAAGANAEANASASANAELPSDDADGEGEGDSEPVVAQHGLETAELGRPSSDSDSENDDPAPTARTTRSRRASAAGSSTPAAKKGSRARPAAAAAAVSSSDEQVDAAHATPAASSASSSAPAGRPTPVRETRATRASASAAAGKDASLTDLLVAVNSVQEE